MESGTHSNPDEGISLELDAIQATVLLRRPQTYFGTHIAIRIDDPNDGNSLIRLITPRIASVADGEGELHSWIAIGISHAVLKILGVPETSLASFSEAFRQGMAARADHLRDTGVNASGNWEEAFRNNQFHVAVTIFGDSHDEWQRTMAIARQQLVGLKGLTLLSTQDFGSQPEGLNPLGYRDGISEPTVEGSPIERMPGSGRPIRAGEFILGYSGESGEPLQMPKPEILGRNGTYVAFRKYRSRLGAFNDYLNSQGATEAERELVAAKLVGRWRLGAPLMLAPEVDNPALGADYQRNNDFVYASDPDGRTVPKGCHIRRMNPRDSDLSILTDPNVHRLVRRGTSYGKPYDPKLTADQDDTDERGIYFMLISAKAPQTLEFLQEEWVNSGNFQNLGDERDPIIGLHDQNDVFTIPKRPVRKRLFGIQTFNVLKGGDYLFMPSLPALRWIAELRQPVK